MLPAKESAHTRLIIPSIHVDASVRPVGLAADGAVEVLGSTADVGWYKLGAYPGQLGSAVLDGHIDTRDGSPGVFYSLSKLTVGSKVYMQDNQGMTTFVVWKKISYSASAQPAEVFDRSDKAYLNLITCSGSWDRSHKEFTERLVVFAVAVKTEPKASW